MSAKPFELRTLKPASDYDAVFEPIRRAAPEKPFVIAQLGQSLDGRIATPTGASQWINGGAALDHLHRLRAHVDAVIVGIGTAIADDPQLTVRRVPGRNPARVVIDLNGRLPDTARCLNDDGTRTIIVRGMHAPRQPNAETIRLPDRGGRIEPGVLTNYLFAQGMRKILVEGGATTVSKFLDDRVLDRIHLLVAPIILGSGTPGLSLNPIAELDAALRPATRIHQLDDGDVLFDCDMRDLRRG